MAGVEENRAWHGASHPPDGERPYARACTCTRVVRCLGLGRGAGWMPAEKARPEEDML